jgi:plastocyanin
MRYALLVVGFVLAACSSDTTGGYGYGGAGGTAGAGGSDASGSICGCTQATSEDHTAQSSVPIAFGGALGNAYAPQCIVVKAGAVVTFSGDFAVHPLAPSPSVSGAANPVVDVGAGTAASVTFSTAGSFGYHCQVHGSDDAGMCGAVYVVP